MNSYFIGEKKSKIILIISLIALILYIFLSGHFLPAIYSPAIIVINVGLDEHYHSQFSVIKSDGNRTINKMVDNTAKFGKESKRLNVIADLIVDNFTDIYWPSQQNDNYFCYYKGEWIWCAPYNGFFGNNPGSYGYITDKQGRVRTILSNELNYDPEWIAYQKTGACEAISILFNETANRSGFVSRIVHSDSANHTWNEVMINGEWKYYDVQRYGQVKNTSDSSFLFGNRSEYGYKSGFTHNELNKNGICVFDLQNHKCGDENVTQYYIVQL
jgi:hypothetical protein